MKCIRLVAPLVVLGLLAHHSAARAQMIIRRGGPGGGNDPGMLLDVAPGAYGVTGWHAGEWARYNSTQALGPQMTMTRFRTFSILENTNDKWWVEIEEESTGAIRLVQPLQKILVPFGSMTERTMSEALILFPDSSIRHTTVLRPPKGNETAAFPQGWQKGADESITTPAGTFKASKYKKGEQELWVSASASPLGLVRYRNPDTTIELVARGATGAKSKIPEGVGQ